MRERENGLFKEEPSKKAILPVSRGKNRISQGVENRGSLISVPLALRVFLRSFSPAKEAPRKYIPEEIHLPNLTSTNVTQKWGQNFHIALLQGHLADKGFSNNSFGRTLLCSNFGGLLLGQTFGWHFAWLHTVARHPQV